MEENDQMLECSGFEVVREGRRPFFRTPKPHRRQLYKMTEVRAYLEAEHIGGRLLNVHAEHFNFASRKRKSMSVSEGGDLLVDEEVQEASGGQDHGGGDGVVEGGDDGQLESVIESMVRLLHRDPGINLNHR